MYSTLIEALDHVGPAATGQMLLPCALLFIAAYFIGSIPFSYIIARAVTGADLTDRGTGNVGAMNVRRTTGSWFWFTIAMLADGLKGFLPTLAAVLVPPMLIDPSLIDAVIWMQEPQISPLAGVAIFGPATVLLGCVLGHNYSLWLSLAKRRVIGGKGLATGAGALLAYNWIYFFVVLAVGLGVIAVTRYMMAGQVAAVVALPVFAIATGQRDVLFTILMAALVYARHHRRFVGLLRGEEPRMYVEDAMGPMG
ncbi:MAG: glycerol-3-phosphate acyltransferase [Coriobacteriia bacterium]|nr:glycerol-3-phosphate acyltransferase [Coriobacteriia bacterium]